MQKAALLRVRFCVTPFVATYRLAEGSTIELLVRINTQAFLQTSFFFFVKSCFQQRNEGTEAAALEKRRLLYFHGISPGNSGTFLPVATVEQRGVKSET